MDYEEIADERRFRTPLADRHYESMHGEDRNGGPGALAVSYDGGLSPTSPSATLHHVDPALYSKVIRRCLPA